MTSNIIIFLLLVPFFIGAVIGFTVATIHSTISGILFGLLAVILTSRIFFVVYKIRLREAKKLEGGVGKINNEKIKRRFIVIGFLVAIILPVIIIVFTYIQNKLDARVLFPIILGEVILLISFISGYVRMKKIKRKRECLDSLKKLPTIMSISSLLISFGILTLSYFFFSSFMSTTFTGVCTLMIYLICRIYTEVYKEIIKK